MQKLFKNASLVNIENESQCLADILVKDGKFEKIGQKTEKIEKIFLKESNFDEVIDLDVHFVLPCFVNAFCDSEKAFANSYDFEIAKNEKAKKLLSDFMLVKNLLAGCVYVNDVSMLSKNDSTFNKSVEVLEQIGEKSEKELSDFSDSAAKNKSLLFIKIGQSLYELGALDKTYGKTASEVLEDFGFLDRKNVVIVGGNCFEKDELRLLKNYDSKFALTVGDDARSGKRPTNIVALKNLDFEIGLGSGEFFEVDFLLS